MLTNISVKVDIQQVAGRDFSSVISGRKFDMFYSGLLQNDPFAMAHICHIYCSDSQFNLSATTNPAFDAQVKSVNTLPTAQQQFAQGNEVETEAFKTYGLMPTLILPSIIAVKRGLANLRQRPLLHHPTRKHRLAKITAKISAHAAARSKSVSLSLDQGWF